MRLRAVAENPIEWALDRLGLLPRPLADTIVAMLLSRTVLTGTKLGVFEALADGAKTVDAVAEERLRNSRRCFAIRPSAIHAGSSFRPINRIFRRQRSSSMP